MGCHPNVSYDVFPEQGKLLGKEVNVSFNYQPQIVTGICVRDDMQAPWLTIFKLPDDRHVLATECQYYSYKY